jgi:hypothetical protein
VQRKSQVADWNTFAQLVQQVPSEAVLRQSGGYRMIHLPTCPGIDTLYEKYEEHGVPLTDVSVGYVAKTGPVVWNRLKSHLRDEPAEDTLPLVWANSVSSYHFAAVGNRDGRFGYLLRDERTASLVTHGPCLLVQRTTAKEQRRRIVAVFPLEWERAAGSFFVENHVNLVAPVKGVVPLPLEVVLALLNSRLFDFIFRTFNGNTQVSATELNVMRLAVPDALVANQVVNMVEQVQSARAVGQRVQAAELVSTLDQVIYHLYGLTPDEIEIVESHTRRAIE